MTESVVTTALGNIRHQAKLMKENLHDGHLLQALKHSSNFLNELRTSALSPKQYYELYMTVYDRLDVLYDFLLESHRSKKAKSATDTLLTDLYELVQYSGNIIPRLYMMIVIGVALMASHSPSTKEIMKDMMEMCRGVQHPVRGLFLRHHLSQRMKDLYPLSTTDDFNDTVNFLITNFIEMNKLWVRLQHQGHSSDRDLRLQERKELKILVGSNLVRLSQVVDDFTAEDYSSADFYVSRIFPAITEQIIQSRDLLAQGYLIDVLIQIFPDTFHFRTLDRLLHDVFLLLQPAVAKSDLVATLIDRFVLYHQYEDDLMTGTARLAVNTTETEAADGNNASGAFVNVFELFVSFYQALLKSQPDLPAEEFISILRSLIKLSLTCEPENFDNLNKIYELAAAVLRDDAAPDISDTETLWQELLQAPISHFSSIKLLLKLPFYHALYAKIKNPVLLRRLGLDIAAKILGSSPRGDLSSTEDIDDVFKYLSVLIVEPSSEPSTSKDLGVTRSISLAKQKVSELFLEAQEAVCKVLHLINCSDRFQCLSLLFYVKKKYLSKAPENIVYTYPTLVTRMTALVRHAGYVACRRKCVAASDQTDLMITRNFKNTSVVIGELYKYHREHESELVFKLYLNLATVADQLKQETVAYELFNQCFILYEESLLLNMTQSSLVNPHECMGGSLSYQAVLMIANRLQQLRYFTRENYESLITKLTLYGSKLLKKQDQCRSVYYCAHLWWWVDPLIDVPSPTVESEKVGRSQGERGNERERGNARDRDSESERGKKREKDSPREGARDSKTSENEVPENASGVSNRELFLYQEPKRVLECLQKSLRIADSCMDSKLLLKLFVNILNRCLIFNDYWNTEVDFRYINGLIELIRTNLATLDDGLRNGDEDAMLVQHIQSFFDRTLGYARRRQETEGALIGIIV